MRKSIQRLASVAVGAIAIVGGLAGPAHANVVTTSQSGSPGYWYQENTENTCGSDWFSAYIFPESGFVTGSPAYPRSTQVVSVIARLDYWNGKAWVTSAWSPWQTQTLSPGAIALFAPNEFMSVAHGRYYRVAEYFYFSVGGKQVGMAVDLFDQSSYVAASGASVGATGTAPSYCYVS